MSDEKTTVYISPEEDLTSVRERLEKIPERYITLVIPTETQLRSHVAWKLLRARVRELGKEVQIVSDSAQVRSTAQDVNFKVASSLVTSPTSKSRPPSSRPGRVLGNRSRPRPTGPITNLDNPVPPQSLEEDLNLLPEHVNQADIIRESLVSDKGNIQLDFPNARSENAPLQKGNESSPPVTEETTSESAIIELRPRRAIPHKTSNTEVNDTTITPISPSNAPIQVSLKAIKIFYCYAHEDKLLRDELAKHLHPLIRKRYITEWFDREIHAGMNWQQEIKTQLDTADIILLLVSADFIFSDYCYSIEMERALARHKAGNVHVIPVILRPSHWEETPLSELQVLPTGARPITNWPNRDDAFLDVVREIRKVVRQSLSLDD